MNPIIDPNGTKRWYNDKDQLHRLNGPAIEVANGNKYWYQNGQRHRDNGLPAIERSNGDKEWYQNGKRHRLTGPAIVYHDGTKRYCIEDNKYTYEQLMEYLLD